MLRVACRKALQLSGSRASAVPQIAQLCAPGTRQFASANEDVQPPKQLFSVPGKYAGALFVSAAKAKLLPAVETDMRLLSELAEVNAGFRDFLKDPSVPLENRVKAIEDIFTAANFSPITKNLALLLADNRRLAFLPKIAALFQELAAAHKGEVKARITAALELTPAELADVKEALKSYLDKGQTLIVEQTVDRSIIGGLVIELGDKYIDLSISSKIKQLESVLSEAL